MSANCSAGCPTRNHNSWGECIRSKSLKISPSINDAYSTRQRAWDKELNSYESAIRQGVYPEGTKQSKIDKAIKEAEAA